MSSDVAVRCADLSKTYKVYRGQGRGYVLSKLLPWRKERYIRYVPALKNVSCEINHGEVFGILGHNGAGKSTPLACISGLTDYDSGQLCIDGHVDALLQLGTGFDPRFTGRENVIVGSIAMGVHPREAIRCVDDVIAFAELEDFADMPFYTYSAGMQARLQFAVAVHRAPDVLLIDEALSTGDGYFVNKSRRRVEDICSSGSTVVVVTHSISMIEGLCHRAMILDEGEVVEVGASREVGTIYRQMLVQKELAAAQQQTSSHDGGQDIGTGEIAIEQVCVVNDDPEITNSDYVYWDRPMTIQIRVRARERIDDPRFMLQVYTAHEGTFVAQINNSYIDATTNRKDTVSLGILDGSHTIKFRFPRCPFGNNRYYLCFGVMPREPRRRAEDILDYYVFRRIAAYFQVVSFPDEPSSITRSVIIEPPVHIELTQ